MIRCGVSHPEDSSRRCLKDQSRHADHQDSQGAWPNPEVHEHLRLLSEQRKKGRKGRKSDLVDIASAVARNKAGLPGAPGEQTRSADEWQSYALGVAHGFLKERVDPFTTAQHLWPLLDRPQEMRSFSRIVQTLIREGMIEEVGATRLRGTYHTRDGYEFEENKLVPIYRSRLATPRPQ